MEPQTTTSEQSSLRKKNASLGSRPESIIDFQDLRFYQCSHLNWTAISKCQIGHHTAYFLKDTFGDLTFQERCNSRTVRIQLEWGMIADQKQNAVHRCTTNTLERISLDWYHCGLLHLEGNLDFFWDQIEYCIAESISRVVFCSFLWNFLLAQLSLRCHYHSKCIHSLFCFIMLWLRDHISNVSQIGR